jgi:hypothetical protein
MPARAIALVKSHAFGNDFLLLDARDSAPTV